MISTHFATKDSTILPWGFELEEDETLGFFSEPGMNQKGNYHTLLNAKIMNQDSIILADTGADLVVPTELIPTILQHVHDSTEGGHFKARITYE